MYLHDELPSVVVQWWRNKITATNKRIVSNVRVWTVSSGIQPAIEQAIAAGMRAIKIGIEEGMACFCSIWYQLLQVMIGVIAACGVIKWLVNAIQNNARRDRHHQQCSARRPKAMIAVMDATENPTSIHQFTNLVGFQVHRWQAGSTGPWWLIHHRCWDNDDDDYEDPPDLCAPAGMHVSSAVSQNHKLRALSFGVLLEESSKQEEWCPTMCHPSATMPSLVAP
jgi:hypothetical protein